MSLKSLLRYVLLLLLPATLHAESKVLNITMFGKELTATEQLAINKLNKAYSSLGLEMKLTLLPGERALQESNHGMTDGELIRKAGLSKSYPNLIQLKVPIGEVKVMAFSLDKTINVSRGWISLKDYSFAYDRGMKAVEANVAGFPSAAPTDGTAVAFRNMLQGRVKLVVTSEDDGLSTLKTMGLDSKITPLTPPLGSVMLYHYLHKKHADLVPQLERELAKNTH
ncbi:hypothetical protein [Chitinibacter sp. S2-10]|uniref:hypothetical protein n=1 Tax=Chitinibacter sp. S2-10 TaxID=3373597 RepID=UPI0039774D33